MFNTGTVVGVSCNIFGGGFPEKYRTFFRWGGSEGVTKYDFNRAMETAARMMERRDSKLTDAETEVYQHIYDNTAINDLYSLAKFLTLKFTKINNTCVKKLVAANWKMNLDLNEGAELVNDIYNGLPEFNEQMLVVIAPPYLHLTQTASQLTGMEDVHLGAQNCHHEASGAYTGEVAASMLKSAEVEFVIIGHSERREYFKEDDAMLAKKVNQALSNDLKVIFCCGEPLEIRDANTQNAYVEKQIKAGLFHLSDQQLKNIVIAYEPIWAIGTGRTASSAQAQDMHAHIRSVIATQYGKDPADNISILYGGSCKPSNAAELFACPDVDGGLIGGASFKASEFLGIIDAMVKA